MSFCYPKWKKDGKQCPYGTSLLMHVTKQTHTTLFNQASIIGSYVFVLSVVIVLYQIWDSTLKIKYKCILTATYPLVIIINELIFKRILKIQRPEGSCNTTCGFPSGHSVTSSYLAGLSFVLIKYAKNKKLYKVLFAITVSLWLITCISRVGVKDHSIPQVIAGSIEGIVFSSVVYIIFKKFL
jgi:membrane-associated phospholipid phosphatase